MEDRRQSDPLLIALDQRFRDFLDRYERDQIYSHQWRLEFMKKFSEVEAFVNEFKPMHKKVIWVIGLIVGGTVAFWLKWFWAHVKWNG